MGRSLLSWMTLEQREALDRTIRILNDHRTDNDEITYSRNDRGVHIYIFLRGGLTAWLIMNPAKIDVDLFHHVKRLGWFKASLSVLEPTDLVGWLSLVYTALDEIPVGTTDENVVVTVLDRFVRMNWGM